MIIIILVFVLSWAAIFLIKAFNVVDLEEKISREVMRDRLEIEEQHDKLIESLKDSELTLKNTLSKLNRCGQW